MNLQAYCCETSRSRDAGGVFGGQYFIEGMLSFGGMNSPAIYNLPASYLILLAHEDSKLDKRLSIQPLGRLSINYIFIVLIKTGV